MQSSSLKSAFFLLFLSIGVYALSSPSATVLSSPENFPPETSARTLYLNNCARCHSADGTSQTELGKLFASPDLTGRKTKRKGAKILTRVIRNGAGSMPAFGKKMTAKEISSLVSYVRSL